MPAYEDKGSPRCTEVVCSSSVGGKVQIVKYEFQSDFHFSMTRKYDVPETWTEDDIKDFQNDKVIELRGHIEEIAEAEMESLMEQRKEHGEG